MSSLVNRQRSSPSNSVHAARDRSGSGPRGIREPSSVDGSNVHARRRPRYLCCEVLRAAVAEIAHSSELLRTAQSYAGIARCDRDGSQFGIGHGQRCCPHLARKQCCDRGCARSDSASQSARSRRVAHRRHRQRRRSPRHRIGKVLRTAVRKRADGVELYRGLLRHRSASRSYLHRD